MTGRDGKKYAANRPHKPASKPEQREATDDDGKAILVAHEAINLLQTKIGRSNPRRAEALRIVSRWIKTNQ